MSYIRQEWEQAFDCNLAEEPKLKDNKIWLEGIVRKGFCFSHVFNGIKNYMAILEVKRLSETTDIVKIVASEELVTRLNHTELEGREIQVTGHINSWKAMDEGGELHWRIFVEAESINEELLTESYNKNMLLLSGEVKRKPIYRRTPLGKDITEIFLKTDVGDGKSTFICCIIWNGQARIARNLKVNEKIELFGRLQSRKYEKNGEEKSVDEVSAFAIAKTY